MTPMTAQGGTQALEDAGALHALFANIPSFSSLPERMVLYNKVRLIRASRIQLGVVMPLKNGDVNPLKKVADELLEKDVDLPAEAKVIGLEHKHRMFHDFR